MPVGTAAVRSLFIFPLLIFLFGMQVSLFHHRDLPALSASYLLPCPGMPSLTALFFTASATAGARALPAPDPGLSRP